MDVYAWEAGAFAPWRSVYAPPSRRRGCGSAGYGPAPCTNARVVCKTGDTVGVRARNAGMVACVARKNGPIARNHAGGACALAWDAGGHVRGAHDYAGLVEGHACVAGRIPRGIDKTADGVGVHAQGAGRARMRACGLTEGACGHAGDAYGHPSVACSQACTMRGLACGAFMDACVACGRADCARGHAFACRSSTTRRVRFRGESTPTRRVQERSRRRHGRRCA